jgi:hypothetical protein
VLTVATGEIAELLPGAPKPKPAFVNLALGWARGELTRRGAPDSLSGDALLAARTAVAAKALALQAGVGGVISLEGLASGGAAKIIESFKVPDEIEVKYRAAVSQDTSLALAGEQWDLLAATLLTQALPVVTPRRLAVGVAR